MGRSPRSPDFAAINRAALPMLPSSLRRRLPGGRVVGREYLAINPRGIGRRPRSFKINITAAGNILTEQGAGYRWFTHTAPAAALQPRRRGWASQIAAETEG